jgi:hypothetical protein
MNDVIMDIKSAISDIESTSTSRIIRLTWEDWQASRAIKKAALAAKGLSAPSRRTTAKIEARAALGRILQKNRG